MEPDNAAPAAVARRSDFLPDRSQGEDGARFDRYVRDLLLGARRGIRA
ncbi:hypothetical protein [Streptomyces ossamyceticus]